MSVIIAAAIAVIGTLLGAVVAHRYQEKSSARAAARADREREHRHLLEACADFVGVSKTIGGRSTTAGAASTPLPDSGP
ncbi:hypothetical protein ACFWJT_05950 [Streptomyces sp. NPDC127069]|uniref:hypothetical protein n=1 Tax=Streptomyces sp. NPDC127069 TaxID=3347128 RepID=UPI003661E7B4